ncbi:hypothetical protein [Stackebrandtia soli]|uniref:hypothetical protein n=1 Tax=Stackebrandtia soli TaxID=1892856 RepID=UPI0039EC4D96
MGALADSVRRINITATSPDGSVTARMTADRTIDIAFGAEALRRHTDASLAKAAEEAVNGGLRGFQKALSTVYEKRYGKALDFELPKNAPPANRRIHELSGELSVAETSPRGYVKVGVGQRGRVQVRIRPGTVDRLDVSAEQLQTELNSAIAAARATYSRRAHETVMAVKHEYKTKGR